ncbi:MAG: alpha/beta fold hydrolase [Betaproteobacteria bacterium]|nr:alpha/beta fold hydrolase [Betaproteobacteria bacterium]
MLTSQHKIPGLILNNHTFELPLDYANPGKTISVFAREVIAPDKEDANQPYLVFFQGGPGSGSPRPMGASGWIKRALKDYRVLLLDQRGTGLSAPLTAQTLRAMPNAQAQADYIMHFRADNIVRDAEAIRAQLGGGKPWSILGQSYGGFCSLRYLSAAPEGLKEVFITGGVPSLTRAAEEIYRATYPRVIAKNAEYYARYPEDIALVQELVRHLQVNEVMLPSGGRLTAQRFLQLGLQFGMSDGYEAIHYLLEEAWVTGADGKREINWNFLVHFEHLQSFETNPIYCLLQDGCYTQKAAGRWAADRVLKEFPEFALDRKDRVLFTGEMVFAWQFDTYPQLKPLKAAAELLAQTDAWPMLYDVEKLKQNRVPIAAAVYYDDMYVHREFQDETAQIVPNMKLWHTNEYEHNGLRADGEKILGRLIGMVRGEI